MPDRDAYTIVEARYAKGKKVLKPLDSRDGYKGRASYLAEALGGKWVNRSGGYTMSPAAAEKFELLWRKGFHGHVRYLRGQQAQFSHPGRALDSMYLRTALKLAKDIPDAA